MDAWDERYEQHSEVPAATDLSALLEQLQEHRRLAYELEQRLLSRIQPAAPAQPLDISAGPDLTQYVQPPAVQQSPSSMELRGLQPSEHTELLQQRHRFSQNLLQTSELHPTIAYEMPEQPEFVHQTPTFHEVAAAQSHVPVDQLLGRLATVNEQYKELKENLSAELNQIASQAREAGATWSDIAEAVDITPQSAYQRWSERGREKHRQSKRKRPLELE